MNSNERDERSESKQNSPEDLPLQGGKSPAAAPNGDGISYDEVRLEMWEDEGGGLRAKNSANRQPK